MSRVLKEDLFGPAITSVVDPMDIFPDGIFWISSVTRHFFNTALLDDPQ
jgi:hypothetical protein